MKIFKEIIIALIYYDFNKLKNPEIIWVIYFTLFLIIFLENGIIFAAFLPGDTLIILSGSLATKGILSFYLIFSILTIAASLGCWVGFYQGRYLKKKNLIKIWIKKIPKKYYNKTNQLLNKKGLYALIIARFLVFSRTIMPIIIGLSTLNKKNFQIFNWISSMLWIGSILILSYFINQVSIIKNYENIIFSILFFLPVVFILIGLIVLFINMIKK